MRADLHPLPATLATLAAAMAWTASAAAAPATRPNRLQMDHVSVKAVFLLPQDVAAPPPNYPDLLQRHLRWSQQRYRELLFGQDTFTIVPGEPLVLRSARPAAFYKGNEGKLAQSILLELFQHDEVDRFACPFIYVVCLCGTGTFPPGGGRPINGFINTGGGILVIGADNLAQSPNFQSTLQHELGHTFGLVHVDQYKREMKTSPSIMGYNTAHRTSGFQPAKTPGILIPEDYRLLCLNRRAFPKLKLTADRYTPAGYAIFPRIMMLPAMKLEGQPDYDGTWNGK